jgi:hypothetical protein
MSGKQRLSFPGPPKFGNSLAGSPTKVQAYSSSALYLNPFITVKRAELGIPASQIPSSENHNETVMKSNHWTKYTPSHKHKHTRVCCNIGITVPL